MSSVGLASVTPQSYLKLLVLEAVCYQITPIKVLNALDFYSSVLITYYIQLFYDARMICKLDSNMNYVQRFISYWSEPILNAWNLQNNTLLLFWNVKKFPVCYVCCFPNRFRADLSSVLTPHSNNYTECMGKCRKFNQFQKILQQSLVETAILKWSKKILIKWYECSKRASKYSENSSWHVSQPLKTWAPEDSRNTKRFESSWPLTQRRTVVTSQPGCTQDILQIQN